MSTWPDPLVTAWGIGFWVWAIQKMVRLVRWLRTPKKAGSKELVKK